MASRYSQFRADILTQSDAQEQLLQGWVLWQRGRGMSDKTITDRLSVIRRIPDAAIITPQGVDRFLTSTPLAKATRANYHGAIRAWCSHQRDYRHRQGRQGTTDRPSEKPASTP